MINRDRLIRLFTELVSIDSPSRGEREVCRCISEKLRALGFDPKEDDVGEKIGGNTGCLYTYIEGSLPLPPLLFSAHMDTVEPSCGKKAVFHPDGKVTSDGTTVLGADDLSGVCAILEALTALKESGKPIALWRSFLTRRKRPTAPGSSSLISKSSAPEKLIF